MDIKDAQAELRFSFVGGGPGVATSGLVWLAAAFAEAQHGIAVGFAVLFFGGMMIFPASLLVSRVAFRRKAVHAGNGLTPIALESTAAMIAGLLPAFLMLKLAPDLVLPLAALAVGAHYFAFRTLYGDPVFLVLGAVISALALNAAFGWIGLPVGLTWCVAGVELAFGLALALRSPARA